MAISVEDALNLAKGAKLVFGSDSTIFTVESVKREGAHGVYIELTRDDGEPSLARDYMLDVADFAPQAPNVPAKAAGKKAATPQEPEPTSDSVPDNAPKG